MKWLTVGVAVNRERLEACEDLMWALGAVSVTLVDAEDQPIYEPGPGETPFWQMLLLTAMFEEDVELDAIRARLLEDGYEVVFCDEVPDKVWEREWLKRFKPMRFGKRLWVCPTGQAVDEAQAVVMMLDPGLAFGTGTHATTRMCLNWLDEYLEPGMTLLDFGCGSGVLGIAALLLGAERVIAVDNDPQALTATRENATRNGVQDRLVTHLPEAFEPGQFDVVMANILAQPLVELSDLLSANLKPGGHLVLSGIMSSQGEWVQKAYAHEFGPPSEDDGWLCLHARRP